jgi:hypothetical protein
MTDGEERGALDPKRAKTTEPLWAFWQLERGESLARANFVSYLAAAFWMRYASASHVESFGHQVPVPVFPAYVACQQSQVSTEILALIEIEAACTSVSFFADVKLGFGEWIQRD